MSSNPWGQARYINLPSALSAPLPASSVGDAGYTGPFTLPASNLVQGVNVLAVEVHQLTAAAASSGITLSGGGRYYASDRWGFKPELTLFVGSNTFVRIGGGIFYQFGK